MRSRYRFSALASLLGCAAVLTVHAQLLTIPEALERAGKSLSSGPSAPSGPVPTLDQVLSKTDTIVRGIVGQPRSYLSDDQMDVSTDYQILNPVILYKAAPTATKKPEMPTVTVTTLGGVITINGLSFTSAHEALPPLEPGTECLFLLSHIGSRYYVAGAYYGAFRISNGKLLRLTQKQGFAPEIHGARATQAGDEMVRRLSAIHR